MKKWLLLFVSMLFAGVAAKAQVVANFSDGTLDGFYKVTGGGTDSIYVAADPAGINKHVMGFHMTLTSGTNAQNRLDGVSAKNAQVLTYWVYIDSAQHMPDTTVVGVWIMDNHNWNWVEYDTKAGTIPKNKWFPLSFPLVQATLKHPTNFDVVDYTLSTGFQIFGTTWTGVIYVSNINLNGALPTNLYPSQVTFANLNNGWNNGWVKTVALATGFVGDSANTVMYQIKDTVTMTIDTIKSKVNPALDSLIDTTYSRPSGTAFMGDVSDGGNFDFSNQNLLVTWIWADTTLPDSAQIIFYCQDRSNWTDPGPIYPPTTYGIDIPKKVWYPIYFDLSAMNILDSAKFNAAKNKLGWFGIDFGARVDTLVKKGTIYVSRIDMLNNVVTGPPPVWVAADFESAGKNGKQGFYVPSWASGTLKRIVDLNEGSYVLQGTVAISPASPKFAALRDSIAMQDPDSIATGVSVGVYLPSKMPKHGIVQVYVSGGKNDSIAVVDTIGTSAMVAGGWNTVKISKLDSLANIGKFDPTKKAQVGVVMYYPSPYDTTKFSGNVEFDNVTVYGISFSGELPDGVNDANNNLPKVYQLYNNYPNPFNPSTMIKYDLPRDSKVVLEVYDVLGRSIATLVDKSQQGGTYQVRFDGTKYATGLYFVRLTAGSYVKTQKMMLLK